LRTGDATSVINVSTIQPAGSSEGRIDHLLFKF
jgi:hypothetical protein